MILAWIRIKIHLAQTVFWLIDAMGGTAGGSVRIKELWPNVFYSDPAHVIRLKKLSLVMFLTQ